MIFVDTGAWLASVVPSDSDHSAAKAWLSQNTQPLLTTTLYYLTEEDIWLPWQVFRHNELIAFKRSQARACKRADFVHL